MQLKGCGSSMKVAMMLPEKQTACIDYPNKSAPVSKCSDTYGDLLPLVGLQHPDSTALPVT